MVSILMKLFRSMLCVVAVVPLTSSSVCTTRRGTTWVPSSTTRDSWDRGSAPPAVWHSIHTRYITLLIYCISWCCFYGLFIIFCLTVFFSMMNLLIIFPELLNLVDSWNFPKMYMLYVFNLFWWHRFSKSITSTQVYWR